jgi:hypothetical protein
LEHYSIYFAIFGRVLEWCKVAETKNAAIYANVDDEENLYVSWNGLVGKCSWEEARKSVIFGKENRIGFFTGHQSETAGAFSMGRRWFLVSGE